MVTVVCIGRGEWRDRGKGKLILNINSCSKISHLLIHFPFDFELVLKIPSAKPKN
jgi:hypothetical protein